MNKRKTNHIIVVCLLILSAFLIAFCLPHRSKFDLEFKQGSPWQHEELISSFNFMVTPSHNDTVRVTDSVDRVFVPYYRPSLEVKDTMLRALDKELQWVQKKRTLEIETSDILTILNKVRGMYDKGIIDDDTYERISNGSLTKINLGDGKTFNESPTADIISPSKAAATLAQSDSYGIRTALSALNDSNGHQIIEYLAPNLIYDFETTQKMKDQEVKRALVSQDVIAKDQLIIARGDIVTEKKAHILNLYQNELDKYNKEHGATDLSRLGLLFFVLVILVLLYAYLRVLRPGLLYNRRNLIFLILLFTLFVVAVYLLVAIKSSLIYVVPFAMVPILISTFIDSRTAFFIHMCVVVLCSLVAPHPTLFFVMQFIAGSIAIMSIKDLSRRSQLLRCALFILLAYCAVYVALHVIRTGSLDGMNPYMFLYFAINSVLLSFIYLLIFIVEKIFGFTSTVTLVELTDINKPVLRALSTRCPGTFQHSLQVANLAAEAAHSIGANDLLTRAGALYHDIGKQSSPAFFTENQVGVNPHDTLTPEDSAKIVISHVTEGLRIASKAKLPKVIRDFIEQHHGKGRAKYFYTMACKQAQGAEVDPTPYTYPGPNPQTRETSIVMMADACEAASKSLADPNENNINALVDKIIDGQIADGLHNEAPITFRDVTIIKDTIKERLKSFYHTRVAYPDEIKPQS